MNPCAQDAGGSTGGTAGGAGSGRGVYLTLGAASHVSQALLVRELLSQAMGTEFTIALVVAVWMVADAAGNAGAACLSRRLGRHDRGRRLLRVVPTALVLWVPAAVLGCREARFILGASVGGFLPVPELLVCAFLTVGITALLFGSLFPLALVYIPPASSSSTAPGAAYAWDGVGAAVAGLALSAALYRVADAVTLALAALGILAVAVDRHLAPPAPGGRAQPRLWACVLRPAAVLGVALCLGPPLERLSRARFWRRFARKPFELLAARPSPYGPLAVVSYEGQVSLYQSYHLHATVSGDRGMGPYGHLAMLAHPRPDRVLLLNGKHRGLLPHILTHPVQEVVCTGPPPDLTAVIAPYEEPEYTQARNDPRVCLHTADGVRFVARCRTPFDVIVVLPPEPNTLEGNRYYTREFFRQLRGILAAGGLVAFGPVVGQASYAEERLLVRNRQIFVTMNDVFPSVFLTGGSHPLMMASAAPDSGLPGRAEMATRCEARAVPPVDLSWILSRFETEKNNHEFRSGTVYDPLASLGLGETRPAPPAAPVALNTRSTPGVYLNSILAWGELSGDSSWGLIGALSWVPPGVWLLPSVLLAFFCGIRARAGVGGTVARLHLVFAVGAWGSALHWLILSSFQCTFGALYQWVAALMGVLMVGMAAGATLGRRAERPETAVRRVPVVTLPLTAAVMALPAIGDRISRLQGIGMGQDLLLLCLHVLAVGAVGLVVGAGFSLVTRIAAGAAAAQGNEAAAVSRVGGWTHGIDLSGGIVGYLMAACVIMPAAGTTVLALLAAAAVMAAGVPLWVRPIPRT